MALFQIAKHRDRDAAKALLGEQPTGTIVTDRYAVYLFIDDTQRQLCLAHLARDLVALSACDGAPGRLGHRLSREPGRVFSVLNTPGRDLENLQALRQAIAPHRQALHNLLAEGGALPRPQDPPILPRPARPRDRALDAHHNPGRARHQRRQRASPQARRALAAHQLPHPKQLRQPDRGTAPHPPRNTAPARPTPARLPAITADLHGHPTADLRRHAHDRGPSPPNRPNEGHGPREIRQRGHEHKTRRMSE